MGPIDEALSPCILNNHHGKNARLTNRDFPLLLRPLEPRGSHRLVADGAVGLGFRDDAGTHLPEWPGLRPLRLPAPYP